MLLKLSRIAGLLAVLLGFNQALAAEYDFKLHHFLSPKSPAHVKMLIPWSERIMKASNGRISIEVFPSMALGGKPPQLPRQVRDGVVDMAWFVNAYAAGQFPRTEVFELPGVQQGDSSAVNMAMFQMYNDYLKPDFEGLFPLFQHVHGGQALHMASKKITSPGQLAGMKIRIPSRTGAWVLEALGASPVKTSVGEIPVALSKNVIDGAMIPWEIIPPLKIQKVTRYQIEGPANPKSKFGLGKRLGTTSFQVAMNTERWNKLPADIKQIFLDNSGLEWHREVGEIWDGSEAFGINLAVKDGNEHVQLTEAQWAKFETRVAPVVERWIAEMNDKGVDGHALYNRARYLVNQNMQ